MSINLIYNGNFGLPVITTNSYTNNLTAQQKDNLYWSLGSNINLSGFIINVSLLNGTNAFNITPPTSVNATQCLVIQSVLKIQQSFTVTQLGFYTLSFNYIARPGFTFNNMQIYLNGVLFDTVTSSSATWTTYSNSNLSPVLGTNTILFQGVATAPDLDTNIAFTNVKLFNNKTLIGNSPTTSITNNFKSTNIYGGLTVSDYIGNGTTTNGLITTQQTYNYNYTTLPVFQANSLGKIYSYTTTTLTTLPTGGGYINSTFLTLPIGVYIVDAYCHFQPGISSIHQIKLGISTTSGALSSFNYVIENTLVASTLLHSVQYSYILTNTASTTYYFVCNVNIAGTIAIGAFKGNFIRIA